MHNNFTVRIDSNYDVFFNTAYFGNGDQAFSEALRQVPVNQYETIRVLDERDPELAKEWLFTAPHTFIMLRDAMDQQEPRVFEVDEVVAQFLNEDDSYDIEQSGTSLDIDYGAKREEPKRSWMDEMDDAARAQEEGEGDEVAPIEDEEAEDEDLVKLRDSIVHPSRADEADRRKIEEPIEFDPDRFEENYAAMYAQDVDTSMFLPHQSSSFVISNIDPDLIPGQYYAPGERLTNVPIAIKRAPVTENKIRSKKPLVFLAVAVAFVLLVLGVRALLAPPPTQWSAICYDTRTGLVAESADCTSTSPFYNVGYVHTADKGSLEKLDTLPKAFESSKPSGNVEVDTTL